MPFPESKPRTAKVPSTLQPSLSWCISEKGAVSIYGGGRFPVTLYPDFIREGLFYGIETGSTSVPGEILQFMADNEALLAVREDQPNKTTGKLELMALPTKQAQELDAVIEATIESNPRYAANLMSIKDFAKANGGKVKFEQITVVIEALKTHADNKRQAELEAVKNA